MSLMEAERLREMAEADRLTAAATQLPNVKDRCLRSAEHLDMLADRAERAVLNRREVVKRPQRVG